MVRGTGSLHLQLTLTAAQPEWLADPERLKQMLRLWAETMRPLMDRRGVEQDGACRGGGGF